MTETLKHVPYVCFQKNVFILFFRDLLEVPDLKIRIKNPFLM